MESLIPADHRARMVCSFVGGLDLGPLYAEIKAVETHPGRPGIDPPILMTLWLFATLEGVGSARALDRLCGEHNAYRWIRGGVGVDYHSLSDFRVQHVARGHVSGGKIGFIHSLKGPRNICFVVNF